MAILEDLTCGEGGSTGSTVMGRINLNHHQVGDLDKLTPSSNTDLVGAINEVDADNDAMQLQIDDNSVAIVVNADAIDDNGLEHGDLSTLTTTEKSTLVGAINEVDAKDIPIQKFYGVKNSAYAVPDTYGADAATLSATGLVAGRYLVSYSFQADFGTHRDKVLAFKLTGDQAGDEFGKTISTAHQEEKLSHNYSYYKDLPDGDLSYGIVFKDVTGGQGFVVDYVDLMLMYVGPTP